MHIMPYSPEIENINPQSWYYKEDFARFIDRKVATVNWIIGKRLITYHKHGARVVFRGSDILAYLSRNVVKAAR